MGASDLGCRVEGLLAARVLEGYRCARRGVGLSDVAGVAGRVVVEKRSYERGICVARWGPLFDGGGRAVTKWIRIRTAGWGRRSAL